MATVRSSEPHCNDERIVSPGYTTSKPALMTLPLARLHFLKTQNLLNADFFLFCVQHAYEVTTSNNLVSVAVLQKLPNNKAYSVGLALSTLWSQLSLLPVPYSEEQIQTDDYGLCQCCKALIEFIRPFVEEVIDNKENKENEKLKDELLKL